MISSSLPCFKPAPRLYPAFGQYAREKFRRVCMARVARDQQRSRPFDGHANDITFTVNSLDDARAPRIVAEYLPQPADAHVDAAIEGVWIAAPREFDELEARYDAVAVRE